MAGQRITVVISQAQSKNPQLRALEEDIATQLMLDGKVEVSLVPHLYDLTTDHPGMLFLKSVPGDLIVLSWLYPRASRWILDRNGISGQEGKSELKSEEEEEVDEEELQPSANAIGARDVPNRKIYTIDLRARDQAADFLGEIQRIANSAAVQTVDLLDWIGGTPRPDQMQQYLNPQKNDNGNGQPVNGNGNGHSPAVSNGHHPIDLEGGPVKRRWYPVIDYSRCTNCMECIDFCLFGVYGVDGAERILVEQQDNCKKGCPACSRVCPENAIIFPGHKTPAIAGSEEGGIGNLKIDLSKLFGAPSAMELAAQERDTELVADGREAVGMTVGIPKRQDSQPQKRDQLDDLIDGLDDLDF